MRFLIVSLLTTTLFLTSQASAFFGCFHQITGGMANVNSGTCGGAQGLWDSYCSPPHTGYSYGSGFGAYSGQIPPAVGSCCSQSRGCGQGGAAWFGGGHRAGCHSCARPACGGGLCGAGGCSLGSHLRGLFSRLGSCGCRSTGSTWVGGGPLDVYSPVASAGVFAGGVDYGYIDSCSNGGCAGGCGGDAGGEVIMHNEAAPMDGTIISQPAAEAAAPVDAH